MNRRTFFERSGRWVSALLLTFLASFLVLQRETYTPAACGRQGFCRHCLKNVRCVKPEAVKYRQHEERITHIK